MEAEVQAKGPVAVANSRTLAHAFWQMACAALVAGLATSVTAGAVLCEIKDT